MLVIPLHAKHLNAMHATCVKIILGVSHSHLEPWWGPQTGWMKEGVIDQRLSVLRLPPSSRGCSFEVDKFQLSGLICVVSHNRTSQP